MKKERVLILLLSLMLIFCLVAGTVFAAGITYPQPSAVRHTLSEIVDPGARWELVATGTPGTFIEGPEFDSKGQLWVVGMLSGEILKVENGKLTPAGEKFSQPNGAKFGADGFLYVTDRSGELYKFNTATGERTTIATKCGPAHFRGLNDLAFDKYGGIYFTEPYGSNATETTGKVYYLPPGENAAPQLFLDNLAYPNGIAVSADGQFVYIGEFAKNRVISAPSLHVINKEEVPCVFQQYEGGIGPDGLMTDKEGNLYTAHFKAGEIMICDASGFRYGALRLPEKAGTFSTNMTIHSGYLYVTESSNNEIWRIKIKKD